MKKTISFFCIASLIIIGFQPEPSSAQAQGAVRAGATKILRKLIPGRVEKKAADLIDGTITIPNQQIKKLNLSDDVVVSATNVWKLYCKNLAKKQVISLTNRTNISQEQLIRLTAKAVVETIDTCLENPQTLKGKIRGLTLDLVREILSEQHNFQLTSFNRQDS